MKQEAALEYWTSSPFCIKSLQHFPYSFPILICMFPNNCLGLWLQWYVQKNSFYGFKNNNNKKNYWTTAVIKRQNKLCISETSVTQMKTHPYGPSNTKSAERQKIRGEMIDRGVSSRDRENTWLSWAKTKSVAECLGSGFLFGKWIVELITPMSFITSSNLTKWERNHHKGLLGIHLFPQICFLASRGLPLSLSPQRLSYSSFLPVSCIICQICLTRIRKNNCFTSSALTDLYRYGHPRDNETLIDLLVTKV